MQRIYLPNTEFQNKLIISDKELYHQITRVMRARLGQKYVFFDGILTIDYVYEIADINKSECRFELIEKVEKKTEIGVSMNLYQGLPNKFSKLEAIVQKCSEVGYKKILFFQALNSQKLVVSDNKKERLYKIATEAIEQCGGNMIPEILFTESLEEILGEIFVCHTKGDNSKAISELEWGEEINIVIGPEGGLHKEELTELKKLGAKKVFFGERILRSETVAPLVGFYISQK